MAKKQRTPPIDTAKLTWHTAFFNAIRMVLYKYKRWLIFQAEHQLTTDPLRIDVIIIKKKAGAVIDTLIGKCFKRVNLIEYKSPKESLSIYHFTGCWLTCFCIFPSTEM